MAMNNLFGQKIEVQDLETEPPLLTTTTTTAAAAATAAISLHMQQRCILKQAQFDTQQQHNPTTTETHSKATAKAGIS